MLDRISIGAINTRPPDEKKARTVPSLWRWPQRGPGVPYFERLRLAFAFTTRPPLLNLKPFFSRPAAVRPIVMISPFPNVHRYAHAPFVPTRQPYPPLPAAPLNPPLFPRRPTAHPQPSRAPGLPNQAPHAPSPSAIADFSPCGFGLPFSGRKTATAAPTAATN